MHLRGDAPALRACPCCKGHAVRFAPVALLSYLKPLDPYDAHIAGCARFVAAFMLLVWVSTMSTLKRGITPFNDENGGA